VYRISSSQFSFDLQRQPYIPTNLYLRPRNSNNNNSTATMLRKFLSQSLNETTKYFFFTNPTPGQSLSHLLKHNGRDANVTLSIFSPEYFPEPVSYYAGFFHACKDIFLYFVYDFGRQSIFVGI
jgi:hypothetical protein